jgi:hypothetical protein
MERRREESVDLPMKIEDAPNLKVVGRAALPSRCPFSSAEVEPTG